MSKVSKQRKEALAKFDKSKSYSLSEAVDIVKPQGQPNGARFGDVASRNG